MQKEKKSIFLLFTVSHSDERKLTDQIEAGFRYGGLLYFFQKVQVKQGRYMITDVIRAAKAIGNIRDYKSSDRSGTSLMCGYVSSSEEGQTPVSVPIKSTPALRAVRASIVLSPIYRHSSGSV